MRESAARHPTSGDNHSEGLVAGSQSPLWESVTDTRVPCPPLIEVAGRKGACEEPDLDVALCSAVVL